MQKEAEIPPILYLYSDKGDTKSPGPSPSPMSEVWHSPQWNKIITDSMYKNDPDSLPIVLLLVWRL